MLCGRDPERDPELLLYMDDILLPLRARLGVVLDM